MLHPCTSWSRICFDRIIINGGRRRMNCGSWALKIRGKSFTLWRVRSRNLCVRNSTVIRISQWWPGTSVFTTTMWMRFLQRMIFRTFSTRREPFCFILLSSLSVRCLRWWNLISLMRACSVFCAAVWPISQSSRSICWKTMCLPKGYVAEKNGKNSGRLCSMIPKKRTSQKWMKCGQRFMISLHRYRKRSHRERLCVTRPLCCMN